MIQAVGKHLFSGEEPYVYAVLDGASVEDLLPNLDAYEPDYICLYRGELAPDMAEVAPYLVQVEPDSEFAHWVIGQGWGKHWGIFASSSVELSEMRQHFRSLLTVYGAEGKPLLFRYYDPRVLRVYLPTCNEKELATFFGPVGQYILEDEDPGVLLEFKNASGALKGEQISLEQA